MHSKEDKEYESPYCKVCNSCGEDGCCPAPMCEFKEDGEYCEHYLKELRYGYLMFQDVMKMMEEYDIYYKYQNEIREFAEKNHKIAFEGGDDEERKRLINIIK